MVKYLPFAPAAIALLGLGSVAMVAGAQDTQSAAPESPAAPVFTVTSPGAEPRVAHRYTPTIGESTKFRFTVRNTQRMETPENVAPDLTMPPVTFISRTTVQSIADNTIAADLIFESAEVADDPMLGAQVEQRVAPMVGKGGVMKLSNRGEDLGFTLNADAQALGPSAGMLAAVASTLRGVIVVMPEDALGIGATWTTVEQQIDDQGILVTITITHTLESVTDDDYVISLVMTQEAPAQDLPAPPTMPGASFHLDSLRGEGSARVIGSFSNIMPATVTMDLTKTTEITFKSGENEEKRAFTFATTAEGQSVAPEAPAATETDPTDASTDDTNE